MGRDPGRLAAIPHGVALSAGLEHALTVARRAAQVRQTHAPLSITVRACIHTALSAASTARCPRATVTTAARTWHLAGHKYSLSYTCRNDYW